MTDSAENRSKEYLLHLQGNYKHLSEKAIYNIIDINSSDNDWYIKWLCPISLPLTCVFSSEGTLIDLIPGVSRESFLYAEEAIAKTETTGFHRPNRFKMNKKRVIPFLDNLLRQKRYLDSGIYSTSELDQLTDSLHYPYSTYLKLVGELIQQDSLKLQQAAKSLIELETPSSLELYKTEFITAKKVLNPDFDINAEPNIRVDKTIISFNESIVNEREPIDIAIYNDGERPLNISKIQMSCSCLEQVDSDQEIVIGAKGSYIAKFYFTPENEGEISRDIFIASNAINIPILHISILANATNK